jgi:phosphatidate cytidylyltransferase
LLRTRVITALVLAPLVVSAIYLLPLPWFAACFWLAAAAGLFEWVGLAGLTGMAARALSIAALAAVALAAWYAPGLWSIGLAAGSVFWLIAIALVLAYPRGAFLTTRPWVSVPAGLLVCWAAWLALVVIRDQPGGATWLLWLLLLVWSADIGAYFAGTRFGRRRLAPKVSPGKTWEGAAGGLAASLAVATAMLVIMGEPALRWLPVIVLLVVVSIFGDLFESILKRQRGVKDSGALLPGHGGALDRIDSMVASLPVFALILLSQTPRL